MGRSLPQIRDRLEKLEPAEIVRAAVQEYGPDVAMSSSFQTQSVPLLHIVSRVAPEVPVIFLDTGYHFPETISFRDRLVEEWGLNLEVMTAQISRDTFIQRYGDDLYSRDPDLCCYINKVEPMERATEGLDAWISGIRRDQTDNRSDIQILEETDDLVRVHPLASWTASDVGRYRERYDLPEHPLRSEGYESIGCAPCTRPAGERDSGGARSGRWGDSERQECGLHTDLRRGNQSSSS